MIHEIEQSKIMAWDTEYGDYVVWGTHSPSRARIAVRKYLLDVVAEQPEHIDEITPPFSDFENARKMWADPKCLDEEGIWDKSMIQPHTDGLIPTMDWVPYMFVEL